jgi:hypothetical protein
MAGGQAMQRQGFWGLYARLVSFGRSTRSRISAHEEMTGTSASLFLTFTAIALFLILAIVEIDLHRDELRALGLVSGEEHIQSMVAGP